MIVVKIAIMTIPPHWLPVCHQRPSGIVDADRVMMDSSIIGLETALEQPKSPQSAFIVCYATVEGTLAAWRGSGRIDKVIFDHACAGKRDNWFYRSLLLNL